MALALKLKKTAAERTAYDLLQELQGIKKFEKVAEIFPRRVMQEISRAPPAQRTPLASAVQFADEGRKAVALLNALAAADLPFIPKKA